MFTIAFAYFVISIIPNNAQQTSQVGRCATIKPIKDYNGDKILGKWYGYEMAENIKSKLKCLAIEFSKVANKSGAVTMKETVRKENQDKTTDIILVQNKNTSQYTEYITSAVTRATNIVDTDYQSYVVLHQCQELYAVSKSNVIILTKERFPDDDVVKKAREAVRKNKLKLSKKNPNKVDQSNCTTEESRASIN